MSDEQEGEGSGNIAKILLVGFFAFTVAVLGGLHLAYGPGWYQGYAPKQPIPFSHQQHAGDFEIPCLYCHGSAEYAAFAEVPGLDVCMNCHNMVGTESPYVQELKEHYEAGVPIPWVRVHVLPDFVHFNHRAHIAAGLACQTCHGPVEEMEVVYQWAPMTMGWCMDCHRNDDYVTEPRQNFLDQTTELRGGPRPDWHQWLGHKEITNVDVSCSTCHY